MQRHIDWANEPYEMSNAYSQHKTKMTSFGLIVRSKSEQLIAEKLHEMGVPFRYEQVIYIYNERFAPDFTFQDRNFNPFYWEYAGKMNDPKYEARHNRKMAFYKHAAIYPWDNLIVTYERGGNINMGMIEATIKNEIMPRL